MQGINLDFNPSSQPENTYRYALNVMNETNIGELQTRSNEQSNFLCATLPSPIIGYITLNNNEFAIFVEGQIYLFNADTCTTTFIIACPNLSMNEPINGTFKILEDCSQREIYWTDGTFKMLNIDSTLLGTNEFANECSFDLFKCSGSSELKTQVLNSGGFLLSGSYQFAYRYDGKNVQYITAAIPIYSEQIGKDINGDVAETSTTKSIKITLLSADVNKKIVELIVIKTINSSVTVEIIASLDVVYNMSYIYDGRPGTVITLNELLVPVAYYQAGDLIAQYQDQLLLGGLKAIRNLDYQAFANAIDVEWFSIKLSTDLLYKIPNYYEYKTFMGDEVYALGIVFEFCDGALSPVFHIPGREKILGYDDELITQDNPDNFHDCDKERWEVYNTAYVTQVIHEEDRSIYNCGELILFKPGIWERGKLGYNEQCMAYSEIKNCENDLMYPVGNVRHHRIPDRTLVPHFESNDLPDVECLEPNNDFNKPNKSTFIYPIGLDFLNIAIPVSDVPIVRYHIVHIKRDNSNKTVIAKGLTHKCFNSRTSNGLVVYHPHYNVNGVLSDYSGVSNFGGSQSAYSEHNVGLSPSLAETSTIYKFHSPNTSFEKPFLGPTYFAIEQQWNGNGRYYGNKHKNFAEETTYAFSYNFNMSSYNNLLDSNRALDTVRTKQRKVLNSTYVMSNTTNSTFDRLFMNLHQEGGVAFELKTQLPLDIQATLCDVLFPTQRDNSLINPGLECGNIIPCANALYGALKRYMCNQYGTLDNQLYSLLKSFEIDNTLGTEVYGDAFINYWAYRRTALINPYQNLDEAPNDDYGLPINSLIHGYYESDINVDLRHEGIIPLGEVFYPSLGNNYYTLAPSAVFEGASDYSYLTHFHFNKDTKQYINLGTDNYYKQNSDYNIVNSIRPYYGINKNYKTCNCNSNYFNTIAVSDVNDWSIFRYNNILTIPFTYGLLTNILSISNDLYAHAEDNLWRVFSSESKLSLDAKEIYIGHGSLFGAVPRYLFATAEGVAGLQKKYGTLINQFGYHFFDNKAGVLYRFSEGPKPLTVGLVNFFKNNKANNKFIFGYDHRHNRLLYTATNEKDCKNFTISYAEDAQSWISFHSYIPDFYLQTRSDLLSVKGNTIWKHNLVHKYQEFYGEYFPSIIEVVNRNEGITNWYNCMYLQNAAEFSTLYNTEVDVEKTFTHAIFYNSKQNSGKMLLKPHTDSTSDYMQEAVVNTLNTVQVNRKEIKWYINGFEDYVVDYTLPHHYYPCLYPVDYTLNTNIDNTKPYYDIAPFKDTYLIQRFFIDDVLLNKTKFTFMILVNNNMQSYR